MLFLHVGRKTKVQKCQFNWYQSSECNSLILLVTIDLKQCTGRHANEMCPRKCGKHGKKNCF